MAFLKKIMPACELVLDLDRAHKPTKRSRRLTEKLNFTSIESLKSDIQKAVAGFVGCSTAACSIEGIYFLKKYKAPNLILSSALMIEQHKDIKFGIEYSKYISE
jgi:hypothetical protein